MIQHNSAMEISEEPITSARGATRVIAVDDHADFRVLLRRLVDATPGFEVVGEADSGERAVVAAMELQPDLMLIDVEMHGLGGIAAARRIKVDRPSTIVVLVSATHPEDLPPEAAGCLADEIVWKPKLRPALLEQIWRAHRHADMAT
jgi:DNA-binding NarL/FixJ family response regulator